MRQLFKKFLGCQSGNFAPMIALALIPLFIAGGGAMEVAENVRLKTRVSAAADAAVLAAFDVGGKNWRQVQKVAHGTFDANIQNQKRFSKLRRKLSRKIIDNKVVYTYSVDAEIIPLMGGLNPFPASNVVLNSGAVLDPRENKRARLLPRENGEVSPN